MPLRDGEVLIQSIASLLLALVMCARILLLTLFLSLPYIPTSVRFLDFLAFPFRVFSHAVFILNFLGWGVGMRMRTQDGFWWVECEVEVVLDGARGEG